MPRTRFPQHAGRPRSARLVLLALLAASCSARIDPADYPEARLFRSTPLPASSPVTVELFNTGTNSSAEALLFAGGRWLTSREVSFAVVLVSHPRGDLLIDAGLGPDINAQFADEMPCLLKPLMSFEHEQDVRDLLPDPGAIRHILLTHPHWDHAGGILSFPAAEIWHPRVGTDEALELAPNDYAFFEGQLDNPAIRWHDLEFTSGPYENFPASFDFYGDGSIVLVPMPGHTKTSLGVFVLSTSGARYFFTGDTTWVVEGFERPADKFWFSSWLVDRDKAELRLSIVRVHELMQRYPELIVVPTHDAAAQAELP